MQNPICPHCLHSFAYREHEEMREVITPHQYKSRLISQKQEILSARNNLSNARNKMKFSDPNFDLLIAAETILNYLRKDLNRQLEWEGISKITLNRGKYHTNDG